MVGFRSHTPWKCICAICYYGLCLLAFNLELNKAVGLLIFLFSMPTFVFSLFELFINKDKQHLFSIPAFLLVITVSFGLISTDVELRTQKETAPSVEIDETVDNTDIKIDTEEVYVTRSGGKYHKYDCSFIEDREVSPMSVNEAEQSGGSPCSKCIGS